VIYLDHNATTPIEPGVREAMEPYLTELFGNASSVHALGRAARRAVEEARENVAGLLGARDAEEIVFTSGGTESDATAVACARRPELRRVIFSAVEHPAVYEPALRLEREGVTVARVPVEPSGGLDVAAAGRLISEAPALVSIMTANNEYGAIYPIAEVAQSVRQAGGILHTDAVAALGKIDVDAAGWGVDLLSASAHKIGGPKGTGALYVRRGVEAEALLPGGGQERRRRGGTENVAGIVGFGEAARLAAASLEREAERLQWLRNELERRLKEAVAGIRIWGEQAPRLPNTSAVLFPGRSGEAILARLDLAGIAVSVGSACSSGTLEPSPAILALGASRQEARGTVRFSLGKTNRAEDLPEVVRRVAEAVA
jgi:cysteine desulfurase